MINIKDCSRRTEKLIKSIIGHLPDDIICQMIEDNLTFQEKLFRHEFKIVGMRFLCNYWSHTSPTILINKGVNSSKLHVKACLLHEIGHYLQYKKHPIAVKVDSYLAKIPKRDHFQHMLFDNKKYSYQSKSLLITEFGADLIGWELGGLVASFDYDGCTVFRCH